MKHYSTQYFKQPKIGMAKEGYKFSQTPYLSKEIIEVRVRVVGISREMSRISLQISGKIWEFSSKILVEPSFHNFGLRFL